MIRSTRFACGRFTSLSLSLAILFSLALLLDGSPAGARGSTEGEEISPPESIRVIKSDRDGVVFEVIPPALELLPAGDAQDGSVILQMSGYGRTALPGLPEVPQTAVAVGLPPGATPALEIVDAETHATHVGRVAPAPAREVVNFDGILHPDFVPQFAQQYEMDVTAYNSDQLYPPMPVELGEVTWLRDQRIVHVRITPVQVNPRRQEVTVQARLRIRISFEDTPGQDGLQRAAPRLESAAYERVLQSTLLNYQEARSWRETPQLLIDIPPVSPCQATNTLRGNGFRVALDQTGMYALTYDQLAAAGLPGAVPSAKIRMCHLEDEIAIDVFDGNDGIFGNGDRIIFYGESIKTRETTTNIYWFTYDINGADGLRMDVLSGNGTGTSPASYPHPIHLETDQRYYSLFPDDEDYSFDHWYWEQLSYGVQGGTPSLTAPFEFSHKATGDVTVRGEFLGGLAYAQHTFEVRLNGARVGAVASFAGSGRSTIYAFSGTISSSHLENGPNELEVVALDSGDPNGHSFVVNWLEVTAPRQYVATNNRIAFTQSSAGQWNFVVSGFSGNASAYDVSDGHIPAKIVPTSGSGTVSFARATAGATSYELVGAGAYRAPLAITKDTPSNLRASWHQATYLIITDPALNAAVTPLSQWRQSSGLSVMTVFVQDIFDEFGYGLYSTEAIRAFLAFAYANWSAPAPSYVLLAGEGSYDHRNLLGENGPGDDLVPVYLRPGVDLMLGEAAADNQYVAFLAGDMAQMMLGRLPAATSSEMSLLVGKILQYESAPSQVDWNARNLLVVDNYFTPPTCNPDGAGDFFATTNRFLRDYVTPARQIATKVYYAPQPCYPNQDYPVYEPYYYDTLDVQSAVAVAFRQGHQFVIYSGHSAISHWGRAGESFLTASMIPSLNNAERLSIMLPLTCLEGITHYPTAPGISERLLRSPVGGAVASYAPTGLQVQTAHEYLVEGFYDAFFLHHAETMGEGVIGAKVNLAQNGPGVYQDLQDTYGLLGDPALRVHIWLATDILSLPMISLSGN